MPPDRPTGQARELSVDLYRVGAVVLIVLGHWLAASVAYRHGTFVRENPLVELPWTQWLTWIFQTVPLLFLVAGYAGAASWTRHTGMSFVDWIGKRLRAVLGPTSAYVLVVLVLVAAAVLAHADASAVAISGWAVAMHLWFIPVYLVVVALTPVSVAMHRRWGLFAPLALGVAVACVDAISVGGVLPALGWANNLACWLALFQLGVAWYLGSVHGRRALGLAVTGGAMAAISLTIGPYPVSLIGVPGQTVQNSAPPSIVMLAVGLVQAGVLIAIAPWITRWLRTSALRRPLAAANARVMLLYLWHMIAVVILAVVAYPSGMFPAPEIGTAAWWLSRLLWIAVLVVLTGGVLRLVASARSVLAASVVSVPVGLPTGLAGPMLFAGGGAACTALWHLSLQGFAPGGRLPVAAAALYIVGIVLVALRPSRPIRVPTGKGDGRRRLGVFGPYPSGSAPTRLWT